MSFPRYPKYKASGVEWLGEVPEHWEVKRLAFLGTSGMGQTILREDVSRERSDDSVPVYSASEGEQVFGYLSNPQVKLIEGDLVVGARGSIGLARRITVPATCTQTTIWFKPSASCIESKHLHWVMLGCREHLFPFDKTAVPMLTVGQLRSGVAPVPPLAEQRAIAAFLDRETKKIDELVAEQERLIELLKEKRQAVISHAVTKGLDPAAPMKPSGVEWLGDVPAHWEVKKLRFLCDITTGSRDTDEAQDDGEFPFFVRSQIVERIDSFSADCEAVLTAGDGAGVGKVFHHFEGKFDFHQRVYMLSNFRKIRGRFAFHFLRENFYKVALEGGAKSTVDSLRRPMFLNFWMTVPSDAEQVAILAEVDQAIQQFGDLEEASLRAISLLTERRSALISAAVTGQIDVRNAVPSANPTEAA
jgi:type I restriction enzyme S subunit